MVVLATTRSIVLMYTRKVEESRRGTQGVQVILSIEGRRSGGSFRLYRFQLCFIFSYSELSLRSPVPFPGPSLIRLQSFIFSIEFVPVPEPLLSIDVVQLQNQSLKNACSQWRRIVAYVFSRNSRRRSFTTSCIALTILVYSAFLYCFMPIVTLTVVSRYIVTLLGLHRPYSFSLDSITLGYQDVSNL